MIIVGVDPSITCTGVASRGWSDRVLSPSRHMSGKTELANQLERMAKICRDVSRLAALADLVVIEGPAYAKSTANTHKLAGLWWLVASELSRSSRLLVVAPTKLKRFAAGTGNADKGAMRDALVRRMPEYEPKDDNETDAIWLAALGYHLAGDPLCTLPEHNLEALNGLSIEL